MFTDDHMRKPEKPVTKKLGELPSYLENETIFRDIDDVRSALVSEDRCITLFLIGLREKLCFDESETIVLGRLNELMHVEGLFDLTPYKANERGVSRVHCQLTLDNNRLYITDLASTNGTYLNGERLEANKPAIVEKRNIISLGRLPIKILTA